ncbi:uncharacterized protein LTR77_004779 [Saxophila tyrrhenica]|uniref:Uncharacterized protein n=1 Tax=Saxophila tyrrhenica TaxID=1690608 RepID=A0AAV9PE76_9PEZI|nr:hypothetical protein LTR77_004779 [Saxophila tyrrhenica]
MLNECRWHRRRGKGLDEAADAAVLQHATPEDYLYQAYLPENFEKRQRMIKRIKKDDMKWLEERRDWFNVNSRQRWAMLICGGMMNDRPRIREGFFDVQYVIEEHNVTDRREVSRQDRAFTLLDRLFPEEKAHAYRLFTEGAEDKALVDALERRKAECIPPSRSAFRQRESAIQVPAAETKTVKAKSPPTDQGSSADQPPSSGPSKDKGKAPEGS